MVGEDGQARTDCSEMWEDRAMLNLNDVFYFVQVVNHGGFTAAGRVLHVAKSTLSARVQQLENDLNVRLLNRSTRKFSLTDVGSEFYGQAQVLLHEADLTENIARRRLSEPAGIIRISTSVTVAQFALRDILPGFMRRFPGITVVQHASDIMADLIDAGYDLAIRGHSSPLPDSSLVQRRLSAVSWRMYAAPDYLERRGVPLLPQDLSSHDVLIFGRETQQHWQLHGDAEATLAVPVQARFASNDMVALKHAACAGLGLVALPEYVCREEERSGRLQRVLPAWRTADSHLYAVFPFRQGLLPSVRALLDCLADEMPAAIAS
ncbi:MAG: hypothetical protein RLZZ237_3544 [Pseudomonadota bacterium]